MLDTLALATLLSVILGAQSPVPFTTIDRGNQSGVTAPREVTVLTASEWDALWKEHSADRAAPAVDFTREMVVGVFSGSRPTSGYSVEITKIEKEGTGLVVTYREAQPPADAITLTVLTSPGHLVKFEKQTGPVRFRRATPSR